MSQKKNILCISGVSSVLSYILYNYPFHKTNAAAIKNDWEIIHKTYHQDENDKNYKCYFKRDEEAAKKYKFQFEMLKKLGYSKNSDYVYHEVLQPLFKDLKQNFVLLENPYPYKFCAIQHYCYWIQKGFEADFNSQDAVREAKRIFPEAKQIEAYENIPALRTCPDIKHYQSKDDKKNLIENQTQNQSENQESRNNQVIEQELNAELELKKLKQNQAQEMNKNRFIIVLIVNFLSLVGIIYCTFDQDWFHFTVKEGEESNCGLIYFYDREEKKTKFLDFDVGIFQAGVVFFVLNVVGVVVQALQVLKIFGFLYLDIQSQVRRFGILRNLSLSLFSVGVVYWEVFIVVDMGGREGFGGVGFDLYLFVVCLFFYYVVCVFYFFLKKRKVKQDLMARLLKPDDLIERSNSIYVNSQSSESLQQQQQQEFNGGRGVKIQYRNLPKTFDNNENNQIVYEGFQNRDQNQYQEQDEEKLDSYVSKYYSYDRINTKINININNNNKTQISQDSDI
ncbi:hypothetical protein PPERSA_03142 [Pseudocohnilembus persalinus]|uniref:Transmembrane protein n=1 Tax=Pseudocohnilembus persalinus TaxID=266149 RepID=A0A0V0QJD6_PSEPJ|nr:hypothetical protein PPERSA_03142 [Pseudocohnilembus persalinus]|eukprot:KRX02080.1 hypothetical protein PPERSA_03142 [Pseudocohnilembus persalinus]